MQDQANPGSMKECGAAFLTSLQEAAAQTTAEPPTVVRALREHFGVEPRMLPIITESFEAHDHPNVHVAIDAFLIGDGRSAEAHGRVERRPMDGDHVLPAHCGRHARIADGGGRRSRPIREPEPERGGRHHCVQRGLYLIRDRDERMALLVRGPSDFGHRRQVCGPDFHRFDPAGVVASSN